MIRRRILTLGLALAGLAVPATASLAPVASAASAGLRLEGHGFGHGVGMQQWGAYGYALREGRGARWILAHYYPGTSVRRVASSRVRVLLKTERTQRLCGAELARAGRRKVRLRATRCYRAEVWKDGVRLRDLTAHRVRAHLHGTVRVTGGTSTQLRGRALNARDDRSYRGVLVLVRRGAKIDVVNDVALEHYLYGVVPAESPSYWPAAALQAQAIAARSYALRSRTPTAEYDVLPNTASQVYGGVQEETAATTAAVRAVRGLAVTFAGQVVTAYFSASSGGRDGCRSRRASPAPLPWPTSSRSTTSTTVFRPTTTGRPSSPPSRPGRRSATPSRVTSRASR